MINESDIKLFYHYLNHHSNEWSELRAIEWSLDRKGKVTQAWVNNEQDFLAFCVEWNGKRNVYAGVNPRGRNGGSKTEDIVRVTGIPFDVDARRPQEYDKDAATEEEIQAAYEGPLTRLLKFFKDSGFNDPYIDFSGNGFRLIQKVDIVVSNQKNAASKLEAYFNEVKQYVPELDSIFDLPRIIKVPGTMSVKGSNTSDRPHRLSKIQTLGSQEPDQKLTSHLLNIQPKKEEEETKEPDKTAPKTDLGPKLEAAKKNEKIRDLLNGNWQKHGDGHNKWTRSEAEFTLAYHLFFYGMTPTEVHRTMSQSHIGKWGTATEDYRRRTVKRAYHMYRQNPYRFFQEKQFIPQRLGDEIQNQYRFVATSARSELWAYSPERGIWEPTGEEKVQTITREKLKHLWKTAHSNETINYIRYGNYVPFDKLGGPPNIVVMKNGVYNLITQKFTDFDPEHYATAQIPIKHDPAAECPLIDKFLTEILAPEDIEKIYEVLGYCLYKQYPIARIFIFTGEGRNGKSTLIRLIMAFLHKDNVCSISLQSLTEDSFRAANLHNKLANISGDLPAKPIDDTGLIKKCTGGDPITVEKKFRDPFQFYNYAKLIFSANQVPATNDDTAAFHRRMTLVHFPYIFDDNDPRTDPNILDKIITEEELSGLFNKSMAALTRLLERGYFNNEKDLETRRLDYIKSSNPVQYFADQYATLNTDPEHYVTNPDLYDRYVYMCRHIGAVPVASNVFSREVRRWMPYAYQSNTKIAKVSVKVWRGVNVNIAKLMKDFDEELPKDHVGGQKTLKDTDDTDDTVVSPFKHNIEKDKILETISRETSVSSVSSVSLSDGVPLKADIRESSLASELMTLRLNLDKLTHDAGEATSGEDLFKFLKEYRKWTRETFDKVLGVAMKDGTIYSPRPGYYRVT